MTAPLAHLRVLDLSWVMVGPMTGRYLADLGADVIKVESSRRIDPLRTLGPFKDGRVDPERTLAYQFINAGKRSLTLDLNAEAGRRIVRRLASKVDVVIESFTPGVLGRMGLAWKDLQAVNPALVMASTCLFGQTGPDRVTSGVGTLGAAYSGASHLVGWPDRVPTGPYSAWTDSVTPRFLTTCILAALRRRGQTGEGCFIDMSQAEAGLQFLLPAYFDGAANGRIAARCGDDLDPLRAPSGLFACAGPDEWIALDASADAHWQAIRSLVGEPLAEPRFDTLLQRLRHRRELHERIEAWTRTSPARLVERRLQAVHVPAHVVCKADELAHDEDLHHDGYYGVVDDPVIGRFHLRHAQCRIDPAATVAARPAPRIGDSTDEVLRQVGGFDDAEIDAFRRDGALS